MRNHIRVALSPRQLVIAILTASWEPSFVRSIIHPTRQIAFSDLTISLPASLLSLELAIVAVLHLFAFPVNAYAFPVGSEISPVYYRGGFAGIRAIADAMNPWDQIKAFARGTRWLFVGQRHRLNDPSYKDVTASTIAFPPNTDINADTSYPGPITANIPLQHRRTDDDEGKGLIANAAPNPTSPRAECRKNNN
jgi:hypothetical protein